MQRRPALRIRIGVGHGDTARSSVVVATPQAAELAAGLTAAGASVEPEGSAGTEKLAVTGLPADRVGALAFENRIRLDELTTRTASLEAALDDPTTDRVISELHHRDIPHVRFDSRLSLCLHTPMITGGRAHSRTSPRASAKCVMPGSERILACSTSGSKATGLNG